MKKLQLAKDLALPIAAVTEKFAIPAGSGAGKTYTALKLMELMLDINAQVIGIDPIGTLWAIRSGAKGKGGGYPVVVFGGTHGDIPLHPEAGEAVGVMLAEQKFSAILDVSDMSTAEVKRFVRDFAETFHQTKKRNPSAVHLFVEEAQTFVPQRPEKDEGVMLNRMERMMKQGRNYGLGFTLITQQPQAVHKAVLNLCGTVIAMRTFGPHERKAIVNWVTSKVQKKDDQKLLEMLPELETGQALVWSPSFLKTSKVIRVLKRVTFDASATPEVDGQLVVNPKRARVDLSKIADALAAATAEAQDNDPVELKKRLESVTTQLRQELAHKPKEIEVPVLTKNEIKRLEKVARTIADAAGELSRAAAKIAKAALADGENDINRVGKQLKGLDRSALDGLAPGKYTVRATSAEDRGTHIATRYETDEGKTFTHVEKAPPSDLSKGELSIMKALAQERAAGHLVVPKPRIALMAGYSLRASTFGVYLAGLRKRDLIDYGDGSGIMLTPAGELKMATEIKAAPQTPDARREQWLDKLSKGPKAILSELIKIYPSYQSKQDLASSTGYSLGASTFGVYMAELNRLGLIERDPRKGLVRASKELFS
ncbi:MAG TPA: helicase HerA-like domain-containing protein [Archangium sp.]